MVERASARRGMTTSMMVFVKNDESWSWGKKSVCEGRREARVELVWQSESHRIPNSLTLPMNTITRQIKYHVKCFLSSQTPLQPSSNILRCRNVQTSSQESSNQKKSYVWSHSLILQNCNMAIILLLHVKKAVRGKFSRNSWSTDKAALINDFLVYDRVLKYHPSS